jgi:hypothetical protein
MADLGPSLPHHDLAHCVVERRFGLKEGFFGKIARGYTPAQLSDKEIVKGLGPESLAAEILARALQALTSGSCTADQFEELVNAEFGQWAIPTIHVSRRAVEALATDFKRLVDEYRALDDGETIRLEF